MCEIPGGDTLKRLIDLIVEKKLTRFLGRNNEILLMMESLVQHKGDWHILHFYGPAGIGKTTLLSRFEQTIAKPPILHLNENADTSAPDVFLRPQSVIIRRFSPLCFTEKA